MSIDPQNPQKVIALVGPTASGKTALSLSIARVYSAEIVSADSRQIYRGMDIGTDKATQDSVEDAEPSGKTYCVQGIPHYMIDVVNPNEIFTLAQYQQMAFQCLEDIFSRGKVGLIVGGTGLYVRSLVENYQIPHAPPNQLLRDELEQKTTQELLSRLQMYDPHTFKQIDIHNRRRIIRALEVYLSTGQSATALRSKQKPRFETLMLGMQVPRDQLYERIDARVDQQIQRGLIEEVKSLLKRYDPTLPAFSGLGYKQIMLYLDGKLTLLDAVQMLKRDTRHYAVRQLTWFAREKNLQWCTTSASVMGCIKIFLGE